VADRKPIVRIECPTAGHPRLHWIRCINDIMNKSLAGRTNFLPVAPFLHKCADIPMGRNLSVEGDLKPEHPWDFWLWFDDDETCSPEDVEYLVEDMVKNPELMMVAGIVSKASEEEMYMPLLYNKFDRALSMWGVWTEGWEEPKLYMTPEHDMWFGTGFTMIRREVFDQILKPLYYAMVNPRDRTKWHGHDLEFCDRVKQAGMKIGVDSRCNIGHAMTVFVTPREHFLGQGWQRKALTDVKARSYIEASKKADINTADFWDAAWSQTDDSSWTEQRTKVLNEVASRIADNSNVLVFGCGPGYFLEGIQKSVPGVTVRGVDLSGVAIARAKARGLSAEQADLSGFSPNGDQTAYDYIVVIDWLERLPDPHKTFKRLVQCLKPEGQMIVVAADRMDAIGEHHHVISQYNFGAFLRDVGGRTIELTQLNEPMTGPDGKPFAQIPRLFARAVFKEKASP